MSRRARIQFRVDAQPGRLSMGFGVHGVQAAIAEATYKAALFAKALWMRRAQDLGIRRSGSYISGIIDALVKNKHEIRTEDSIDVAWSVINRSPHARIIEEGHSAFHLPSAIDWSASTGRIKRGLNGPYLHIPFRHSAYQSPAERERSGATYGTLRSMMPSDVYGAASQLTHTTPKRVGPIYRSTAGGSQFVAADRYTRGGRYRDETTGPGISVGAEAVERWRGARMVLGRNSEGKRLTNPAWKTARFQGLFRGGSPGHSEYMTVRTITPRSAGWNIPAAPAHGVARQVARAMSTGPGGDRFRRMLVESITQTRAQVGP